MAWFEVFIPGKSKDIPSMTLTVEAPNWIGALRTGLSNIGEGQESISNVMCDIKEDNSIHVTDVASHRVFRLREVDKPAAASGAPPPAPPPDAPATPTTSLAPHDTSRAPLAPPPPANPSVAPVATTPMAAAPSAVSTVPDSPPAHSALVSTVGDGIERHEPHQPAAPLEEDAPPTLQTTLDAPTGQSTIEMSIPWATMPAPTSKSPLPSPNLASPSLPAPVGTPRETSTPAPTLASSPVLSPPRGVPAPTLPGNLDETVPLPVAPAPKPAPSPEPLSAPTQLSNVEEHTVPLPVAPAPTPMVAAAPAPAAPAPAAPAPAAPAPAPASTPASASKAQAPVEPTERLERTPARRTGPVSAPTPRGTPAPKRTTGQFENAPRPISREVSKETLAAPSATVVRDQSAVADALADVFDATQDLLLSDSLGVEQMASALLDIALAHIPAESGSFYIADVNAHTLRFAAVRGPKADAILKGNFAVPVGQGIVGFCVQEGVCLGVKNIAKDPRHYAAIARAIGYEPRDTLCASAEKDGRTYGAIQLINSRTTFDIVHMEVLRFIGLTAAQLLEHHEWRAA